MEAILNALTHKSYSKEGKTFDYYEALLTFNENDTCFVNCQLQRPLNEYKVGEAVDVGITVKAWNHKPSIKYTLY